MGQDSDSDIEITDEIIVKPLRFNPFLRVNDKPDNISTLKNYKNSVVVQTGSKQSDIIDTSSANNNSRIIVKTSVSIVTPNSTSNSPNLSSSYKKVKNYREDTGSGKNGAKSILHNSDINETQQVHTVECSDRQSDNVFQGTNINGNVNNEDQPYSALSNEHIQYLSKLKDITIIDKSKNNIPKTDDTKNVKNSDSIYTNSQLQDCLTETLNQIFSDQNEVTKVNSAISNQNHAVKIIDNNSLCNIKQNINETDSYKSNANHKDVEVLTSQTTSNPVDKQTTSIPQNNKKEKKKTPAKSKKTNNSSRKEIDPKSKNIKKPIKKNTDILKHAHNVIDKKNSIKNEKLPSNNFVILKIPSINSKENENSTNNSPVKQKQIHKYSPKKPKSKSCSRKTKNPVVSNNENILKTKSKTVGNESLDSKNSTLENKSIKSLNLNNKTKNSSRKSDVESNNQIINKSLPNITDSHQLPETKEPGMLNLKINDVKPVNNCKNDALAISAVKLQEVSWSKICSVSAPSTSKENAQISISANGSRFYESSFSNSSENHLKLDLSLSECSNIQSMGTNLTPSADSFNNSLQSTKNTTKSIVSDAVNRTPNKDFISSENRQQIKKNTTKSIVSDAVNRTPNKDFISSENRQQIQKNTTKSIVSDAVNRTPNKDFISSENRQQIQKNTTKSIVSDAVNRTPNKDFISSENRQQIKKNTTKSVVSDAVNRTPNKDFISSENRQQIKKNTTKSIVSDAVNRTPNKGFMSSENGQQVKKNTTESIVSDAVNQTPNKNFMSSENGQQIKLSPGISASPQRYFGSPKKSSPSKRLSQHSPFSKSKKNKPFQFSCIKQIDSYFSKLSNSGLNLNRSDSNNLNHDEISKPSVNENGWHPQAVRNLSTKFENEFPSFTVINETSVKIEKQSGDNNGYDFILNSQDEIVVNETSVIIEKQSGDNDGNDFILNTQDIQEIIRIAGEQNNNSDKVEEIKEHKEQVGSYGEKFNIYSTMFRVAIDGAKQFVVMANELYLLNEYDHDVRFKFLDLPESAKLLYCKLFNRKYSWIRKNDMKYNDISEDLQKELIALQKSGFVSMDISDEPIGEILEVLNVRELKKLCSMYRASITGKKSQLIASLLNLTKSQKVIGSETSDNNFTSILKQRASEVIGVGAKLTENHRNTFLKYMRLAMFSYEKEGKPLPREELYGEMLNRYHSKFPECSCQPTTKVFYSLHNFEEYERALLLNDEIELAFSSKNFDKVIDLGFEAKNRFLQILNNSEIMEVVKNMPDFLRKYTAGNWYGLCIFKSISAFKRKGKEKLREAVPLLQCILRQKDFLVSKRGKVYLELIIIANHHLKNYDLLVECFKDAVKESEINLVAKFALHDQATKIKSRLNIPKRIKSQIDESPFMKMNTDIIEDIVPEIVHARSMESSKPGNKRVYIRSVGSDKEYTSVEEVVLNEYKKKGFQKGYHDEGKFLKSILLSCFYDIIYGTPDNESETVSVFINIFQDKPLDWMSSHFYEKRKVKIQGRLKQMETQSEIMNLVTKCCEQNEGVTCVINWNFVSKERLPIIKEFIECLPIQFILLAADHLLKDFRSFSSGFPDLTLWNPSNKTSIFVEVKGENDTLSFKQSLWLRNIKDFGAEATVCYVKDPHNGNSRTVAANRSGSKKLKLSSILDSQEFS